MPTSWNTRPSVSTSWGNSRLGGAYLCDNLGNYILTMNSERIIVIVPGGDLPITSWDVRDNITTNWSARTPV